MARVRRSPCATCVLLAALAVGSVSRAGRAETAPGVDVDRASVRFFAPETGGADHPRFVLERVLAFEARLEAAADSPRGAGDATDAYQERHAGRAALEHDVAEQVLASLARKLIDGSPASKTPDPAELASVGVRPGRRLQLERLGGRPRVDAAAAAEQLDASEVDAILGRQALAGWNLDRAVSPVLKPSEEQLRDVFRSSAHPYGGRPFDEVREALARWFVLERVRVAESSFFQATRSHVTVIVTR